MKSEQRKDYCSMDCWNLAKRKHFGYICKKCGEEFHGTGGHSNNYCSQKCYWESMEISDELLKLHARESTQRYRREHPDWYRAVKQKRRALEKGAEGSFSGEEWKALVEKHKGKCAICKEKKKLTVDHKKPLSKGGTNYIENIQPLCIGCNSRKKDKDIV